MSAPGRIDLPLMENNITRDDLDQVIKFLQSEPILTNSAKCRQFEEEWSRWLGVKYSVFVNSGSSANMLTMELVRDLFGPGEVIVPTLTWVSDIVSVMRAGHQPVFVDINPRTLGMDEHQIIEKITNKTRAVFLTHVLGFNALSEQLLGELQKRKVMLVEDVSESHGATFKGRKLGTFGAISNFSYYFAHHMSTIEGGMVCTNDEKIYQMARMYRSHGMTREATNEDLKKEYAEKHSDLRPEFIFAYPGYNFRSTEINAIIGLSQLKRLDANNEIRRRNLRVFLENIDSGKYFTDFITEGSCNYAFVLVLKKADPALCERLMQTMREAGVEFRRGTAGGGNQLRQPYLKAALGAQQLSDFPQVDHIHFYGFYIGNFPTLQEERIKRLCELVNAVK